MYLDNGGSVGGEENANARTHLCPVHLPYRHWHTRVAVSVRCLYECQRFAIEFPTIRYCTYSENEMVSCYGSLDNTAYLCKLAKIQVHNVSDKYFINLLLYCAECV